MLVVVFLRLGRSEILLRLWRSPTAMVARLLVSSSFGLRWRFRVLWFEDGSDTVNERGCHFSILLGVVAMLSVLRLSPSADCGLGGARATVISGVGSPGDGWR